MHFIDQILEENGDFHSVVTLATKQSVKLIYTSYELRKNFNIARYETVL